MPLPKSFGIAKGWPVAPGKYQPPATPIVIGPGDLAPMFQRATFFTTPFFGS